MRALSVMVVKQEIKLNKKRLIPFSSITTRDGRCLATLTPKFTLLSRQLMIYNFFNLGCDTMYLIFDISLYGEAFLIQRRDIFF